MEHNTGYAELTVQADMRYAGLFRALVREMAMQARLPEKQIRSLELVVDEAYTNVVEHAYEPGCAGIVSLTVELDQMKLLLSFRDQGIPFDDSPEPPRLLPDGSAAAGNGPHGKGLKLIRSLMDEVEWVCLGPKGKELRLTHYLEPDRPECVVAPAPSLKEEEDNPPAPAQTYTVRRFRPEDANGVVRCVYDAYGYTYPSSYIYYPQRIVELNGSGTLVSGVAISDLTGEVVGHCSAIRCYPGGTAEGSQAVVKRAHQGQFLLSRISKYMEEEILREGVHCVVSHEVTSHRASQILMRRGGFRPCAIALGAMPATLDFKKMTGIVSQRESCHVSMKFLVPPEPTGVCAPSHHHDMIERIYASLEKPVTFESLPSPTGPGAMNVRFNSDWGIADIHVQRIGTDTPADIKRSLRDLCEIGNTPVIYLELPLDQGGMDDCCRAAEAEGFFFAGLGPSSVKEGESLYLQYLNTELDMSLIQIATPMGREIFEYVARERERVRGLGTCN